MPGILFGKLKIFYGLNMQTFRADFFKSPRFLIIANTNQAVKFLS